MWRLQQFINETWYSWWKNVLILWEIILSNKSDFTKKKVFSFPLSKLFEQPSRFIEINLGASHFDNYQIVVESGAAMKIGFRDESLRTVPAFRLCHELNIFLIPHIFHRFTEYRVIHQLKIFFFEFVARFFSHFPFQIYVFF